MEQTFQRDLLSIEDNALVFQLDAEPVFKVRKKLAIHVFQHCDVFAEGLLVDFQDLRG